ncbi:D-beta-hydroxybutyrate dehydrogenase [Streptomyces sp. S4.7]|uniref:3-hydroxybutyrate dehydrogenase n=1 Tax=unclassified Streptomyces TaxID=2593676 RepID=UPI0011CA9081|nr:MULTISPECIES: 3-hydroxybutyrate dehydrogenase [unclassified Streptomyces]QHY94049.1 D-beta-hydroxybutyrate dehydrogenase [Streptomyces sp. S4.7]TXL88408.1 3-hydroxybutyrate dehydrogenase [Streptomyces sp. IB2014 016-6]
MKSPRHAGPDPSAPSAGGRALNGRTALVTGGGSGIGRACAEALAEAGALVHIVDRDADAAKAVAADTGGVSHAVDLADTGAIDRLPAGVDILVNNAGLQHVSAIEDFPPDRFELMQKVMLTAPFLLIRHCLPHMYARGWGRVVNISSMHGLRASPFKSAYVAAKHGLEGLSKVTALEGAQHGVTSNCVNPGYVRTPLVEGQIAAQAAAHGIPPDEVVSDVLLDRSAIKRLIEPEEVAAVCVWLCGPDTGYITGSSLPVDGGWGAG